MLFHQTLTPARTLDGAPGGSKKRVLENISEFIAESLPELEAEEIFNGLINRERLGSTGLGEGVAIPHCRLESCSTALGALIKLPEPIDYDAIDGEPVDLLFVLLVPVEATEEHLQLLASLAERFNQPSFRAQLRAAQGSEALYKAAVDFELKEI